MGNRIFTYNFGLIVLCSCFVFTTCSFIFAQNKTPSFVGYATAKVSVHASPEIQCFGFANKEKGILYDSSTVQNIGSISKTLIGLSLMIAKDKGFIALDRDINDYLDFRVVNPNVRDGKKITLRQLATHTSGIVDNEKYYRKAYSQGTKPGMPLGEFLKEYFDPSGKMYSKKNFSDFKAGESYSYSNIGAALAAYVLERATQIPFSEFTQQNILIPLGMEHSGWSYQTVASGKHATLYGNKNKVVAPYTLITYPDGGFRTTISDLSIYLKALIKGYNHQSTLLSNTAWDEFFEKQFDNTNPVKNINPKEPNSGIFVAYSKSGGIGHTGSDPGVSSIMWFDPKTGNGHIFMANKEITKKNVSAFKTIWSDLVTDLPD